MSGASSDNLTGGAPGDSKQHGQAQNLIDEAQLRQEPTDRDIGANKEATDPRGVLQEHGGTKAKSEARNDQGFKVGDEGDLHDLAAGKQP